MLREKSKWKHHKDESTNAKYRGGITHSSDEAPVMGVERRGCVIRFEIQSTNYGRNCMDKTKPFKISKGVVNPKCTQFIGT